MNKTAIKTGLVALVVTAIGVGLLSAGSATAETEPTDPPPPPWINSDGTFNPDAIPPKMPALDADGGYLREPDGTIVMVRVAGEVPEVPGPLAGTLPDPSGTTRYTDADGSEVVISEPVTISQAE